MRTYRHFEHQRNLDLKDREYDSDDEDRKKMMTFDQRISFINEFDF